MRRQIDPQLKPGDALGTHLRHFLMHDTAPGSHPLNVTGTDASGVAECVFVVHDARKNIGHGFHAAMGVQGESGFVIASIRGSKVVQQQKWIEVVQSLRSNASLKSHTCPFDDCLGLKDLLDASR
jgi:hypothetical protein